MSKEKPKEYYIEVKGKKIVALAKTRKKAMSDFFRMGYVVRYGDVKEEERDKNKKPGGSDPARQCALSDM